MTFVLGVSALKEAYDDLVSAGTEHFLATCLFEGSPCCFGEFCRNEKSPMVPLKTVSTALGFVRVFWFFRSQFSTWVLSFVE